MWTNAYFNPKKRLILDMIYYLFKHFYLICGMRCRHTAPEDGGGWDTHTAPEDGEWLKYTHSPEDGGRMRYTHCPEDGMEGGRWDTHTARRMEGRWDTHSPEDGGEDEIHTARRMDINASKIVNFSIKKFFLILCHW